MTTLDSLGAWIRSRKVELGLGLRVTIAALSSLAIASVLGLRLPLWAVLTSVIVTQLSVGRSLKVTRDYLVGTLGGAIYGGAVAVLVPHTGEGALLLVLVLAVAPLAFIAALNPAYNTATITAIIVLLLPTTNHVDPLDSAIDRVLEVAVGAMTGLIVSFLVLPSRAHEQIRSGAAGTLDMMASVLSNLLTGAVHGLGNQELHRLQDGIGQALSGFATIGIEAERERMAHLSSGPDTGPLLRTLLRLRHDLVMIGRANVEPLPDNIRERISAPLSAVQQTMSAHLRNAAASLRTRKPGPTTDDIQTALADYAKAVSDIREQGLTRGLRGDVTERFFALGFSLEQMRRNLKDLERCLATWSGKVQVAEVAE
jgi:uncharacterized membrane protein YccC